MPTKARPARPRPLRRLPIADFTAARRLALVAVAFAAAELAAGLLIGGLLEGDRAEPLLFFAFRPWLLLVLAWSVGRWPWRHRIAAYVLGLLLATVAEAGLLIALGGVPWARLAAGLLAGSALVTLADLALAAAARVAPRWGRGVAALALAALLLVPGVLRPYETAALAPDAPRRVVARPDLTLITALPIVWGEGGAFDPASRPAAAYAALEREFRVRPIDHLDAGSLAPARLLLVAQPRALAPLELVALDNWVRRGGRALVLADPLLSWPSALAPGDVRRPPATSRLGPLLDHWGLELQPPERLGPAAVRIGGREGARRLVLDAPGRFVARGPTCRAAGWRAACALGSGRVELIADADLLRDDLWVAPFPGGDGRHARLADNPLVIADRLDALAGRDRERSVRPVAWRAAGAESLLALILGALPLLLVVAAAVALPTGLSTGAPTRNEEGTSP